MKNCEINPKWTPGSRYKILDDLADHLVEMSKPEKKFKVLDVACGSGTCTRKFAPLTKKVTAVDKERSQIEKCIDEARKASMKNVEARVVDVCKKLPFKNNSFDLVTGSGALSNLDRPENAMEEIYRVLKPGGQLALGDFLLQPQLHELWRCLSVFRHGLPRTYIHYHQVMDLLYGAGFEPIVYRPFRWTYTFELKNEDFCDQTKERFTQAFLATDDQTKKAAKLRILNGRCAMTNDCFVLVATKFRKKPEWECIEPEAIEKQGG